MHFLDFRQDITEEQKHAIPKPRVGNEEQEIAAVSGRARTQPGTGGRDWIRLA